MNIVAVVALDHDYAADVAAVAADGDNDDDDDVTECSATEFTCHNDRCVPRSRCNDGVNDCWDNSDETSCGIICLLYTSDAADE